MDATEQKYQRAMVIVAHADDAEWGCSGTVAKWCAQGIAVDYLLCTDGSKGSDDPNITGPQLIKLRQEEQLAAGKILGLHDVIFLDHEDAMLQPTLDLRRDIVREIRRRRPEIIITMGPNRHLTGSGYIGHPDHLAVGEATLSAVYPAARDRLTFPELLDQGLEPHKVEELWIMESENADQYVAVTDYMDTAIAALRAHASQVSPDDADKHLRNWRRRIGQQVGMPYAEAFKRFHLA